MSRLFHAKCGKCSRVFSLDSSKDSRVCDSCFQHIFEQSNREPNKICSTCNESFYTPNNLDKCPFCSTKKYSDLTKTRNTTGCKKEKKKQSRKLSYEELIRRQEYKRVFDDEGWDHYLKGRKWDKI